MLLVLLLGCQNFREEPFANSLPPIVARHAHALPVVADKAVDAMLRDKDTFWYDSESMKPAYQNWYGDSAFYGVQSTTSNISSDRSEPFGNANREFPWGHTAGMHRVTNGDSVKFMRLPLVDDAVRPVAYSVASTGFIQWRFPPKTVFGELLTVKDSAGVGHVFEVRTRTKTREGYWTVDVFRPFPTRAKLATKLKRLGVAVNDNGDGEKIILTSKANHRRGSRFDAEAIRDELEPLGESTVKQLLTVPFESCYDTVWKSNQYGEAFAPTNEATEFSIVPKGYDGAFVPVTETSCARCHSDAGARAQQLTPGRDWYGNVRGSLDADSGILSWHPFTERAVRTDNWGGRPEIRPELVSRRLFVPYDPQEHFDYK